MIAKKLKKSFVLILCLALLIPGILQCGISSVGAEAFSWTASKVSSGAFTVSLKFPAVNWGSFDFAVSFDPAVVQMSKKPKVTTADEDVYDFSPTHPNISVGNGSGTFKINGVYPVGEDMTNSATTITFYFSVKSTTADKAKISLTVSEFVRPDTSAINISAPAPVTVTLKTQSTDGGGSSSSSTTKPTDSVTDTSSSTSTVNKPPVSDTDTPTNTSTSTSTKTDTDTPSTSTKTDTTTDTTSSKTSTKTSTKTSSKDTSTKTDTDTGTESDTVTDTEELTDTETNFPISDSSTDTSTDMTDTTDMSDTESTSVSTSILVPQTPNEKTPPSTGMIAGISIGVALVFCGVLTVFALLRHKKED